jgi:hypothetical protein
MYGVQNVEVGFVEARDAEVSFPPLLEPHSLIADGGDGSENGVDGGLRMRHH